jgi:protein transport protein SEC24
LATIAPISNITGGTVYYYPHYDPVVNGGELHYALFRNLTRAYAYDSIMTLRLSNGMTLFDYCTGQGKIQVRDLDISTLDSDKSLAIYFKHEDKINSTEAYLQYAILYTTVYGQRLIRVFNLQFAVSSKSGGNNPWHNIFKTSDVDCVLGLILRKHLGNITSFATRVIR